jgi:hypothetical protein
MVSVPGKGGETRGGPGPGPGVSFDIIGGRDQEQDLEFEALPTSLPETSLRALDAHFGQIIPFPS